MYGKIFDSMYEGTLYGQWEAIVTFQQMIVLCDADGTVDMTPPAIAAITSIPLEIITKGIDRLEAPDPIARHAFQRDGHILRHAPSGWTIAGYVQLVWCGRLPWWKWWPIRSAVFQRDRHTCQYCGAQNVPLEPDHVFPVSRGGNNDMNNLLTACVPCNRAKGAKTLSEWLS